MPETEAPPGAQGGGEKGTGGGGGGGGGVWVWGGVGGGGNTCRCLRPWWNSRHGGAFGKSRHSASSRRILCVAEVARLPIFFRKTFERMLWFFRKKAPRFSKDLLSSATENVSFEAAGMGMESTFICRFQGQLLFLG